MASRSVKLRGVSQVEAIIGRELKAAELSALYAVPGAIERLRSGGAVSLRGLRAKLSQEAAGLERDADDKAKRARALRGLSRALDAHRGVGSADWASMIAVASSPAGPVCPACGQPLEVEGFPSSATCPGCGARPACRHEPGGPYVAAVAAEDRTIEELSGKAAPCE